MASKGALGENKGLKPQKSKTPKSGSKLTDKKTAQDTDDTIAIDLTNPDDLLSKLEQLDLDEEETDALLKRAYEVNRELKKQLELGRKVMDKKLTASSKGSALGHQRRPGSNLISINATPGHPGQRQQTRMASASHSAGSRKQATKKEHLNHPMQSYSYHSYKDKNELKQPKKK